MMDFLLLTMQEYWSTYIAANISTIRLIGMLTELMSGCVESEAYVVL